MAVSSHQKQEALMFVIRAAPNGSCLFISLRIALETTKILRAEECPASAILDGYNRTLIASAEDLRKLIVKWYEGDLGKRPIPSFGSFIEKGRGWLREDILLAETVGRLPEAMPDSTKIELYLRRMERPAQWGSTPEYTAFAFMAKYNVEVYQADRLKQELVKVNSVEVPNALGTIKLLYSNNSHYDFLVSDPEAHYLVKKWPDAAKVLVRYS